MKKITVAIKPWYGKEDKADGGIRRVVEAQKKYLPQFGIEVTGDESVADVIALHGTAWTEVKGKPIINHNHGAMWACHQWPNWAHDVNKQVVRSMSIAHAHTAPSEWVANALTRGMLVYPKVIYHGVDPDVWKPSEEWDKYVLWNKARKDEVSDPEDMQRLAAAARNMEFVSTMGKPSRNVKITGKMPVGEMMKYVAEAGVYLATARETFGIGTLEALSCGVPVIGWAWGGQTEIIKQGITGMLAPYGDYEELARCLDWAVKNRDNAGKAARQDILDRWTWPSRIEQYADLYKEMYNWWHAQTTKVSVVVTCHNLGKYLDDCLESVGTQTIDDWECIVVDDCSTDNTAEIGKAWAERDSRFKYVRPEENLKLPLARNFGFDYATGRYIQFLDADDRLTENALKILSEELDNNNEIHIAYGHLDTVDENGENRKRNNWPFDEYRWWEQMAHLNQLPYSSMMRREVLERTGGYRRRHWRAEDAPLWLLATSKGFRAQKVTQATTLIYRMRQDSKSNGEQGDGDWTAWYPWRMGADNGQAGHEMRGAIASGHHPKPDLVPWGAQGDPPRTKRFWGIPDYHDPKVTVVIPVGPNHAWAVIDAVESVQAQTFPDWEIIVVNASGEEWGTGIDSPLAGAPYVKIVTTNGVANPAKARNYGATFARSSALVWLDADDNLLPHALEEMYMVHLGTDGGLIYTDWLRSDYKPQEEMQFHKAKDFVCGAILKRMQHSNMCMVSAEDHFAIGGFDESMPGWEDWDYQIALQANGVCSYRIEQPCFVYSFRKGTIREDSYGKKDQIKQIINKKWGQYISGEKKMPCNKCPGKRRAALPPSGAPPPPPMDAVTDQAVLLQYQGEGDGKVTIKGPVTGKAYSFQRGHPKYVYAQDAPSLLQRTKKGVPYFLRLTEAPAAVVPVKPEEFVPQPKPASKEEESIAAGRMRIADLIDAAIDADDATLLQWHQEEVAGKNRKGFIKILEDEMARRNA